MFTQMNLCAAAPLDVADRGKTAVRSDIKRHQLIEPDGCPANFCLYLLGVCHRHLAAAFCNALCRSDHADSGSATLTFEAASACLRVSPPTVLLSPGLLKICIPTVTGSVAPARAIMFCTSSNVSEVLWLDPAPGLGPFLLTANLMAPLCCSFLSETFAAWACLHKHGRTIGLSGGSRT